MSLKGNKSLWVSLWVIFFLAVTTISVCKARRTLSTISSLSSLRKYHCFWFVHFDKVKGSTAGTIFGTSTGVTISVLRCLYHEITGKDLKDSQVLIQDKEYYKKLKEINKKDITTKVLVDTIKVYFSILLCKPCDSYQE